MQVVKRCWPYLHAPTSNIATQPNFLVTSWKQVDASSTCCTTWCFNLQQRNFDVWQFLRMSRFASFSYLLLVLFHSNAVRAFARNVRLRSPDIGSSSTLCILVCISTRLTPNTERLLYLLRTTSVYRRRNRGLHGILTSSLNDLERYQMYSSFIT